jgi:hypothetical protein
MSSATELRVPGRVLVKLFEGRTNEVPQKTCSKSF